MTHSQIQAWLDQEDERVAQTIRRYGVALEFVMGNDHDWPRDFAYTIGLFGLRHPELVVLSAGDHTAGALLNLLSDRIRAGENLIPGSLLTFEHWRHRVMIETVPNPGEIVFAANRHYQRPAAASVPVYQLTYDDKAGNFPWEAGYQEAPNLQPRPGAWQA